MYQHATSSANLSSCPQEREGCRMRSCCPECCAQISSCRFVLSCSYYSSCSADLFAGYKEDFSKGQNIVHLMRGAQLAFQQHNKAPYISVTRFVQYVARQFVKCKADCFCSSVWLKTKRLLTLFKDFLYRIS
jgi:hypothetical protein